MHSQTLESDAVPTIGFPSINQQVVEFLQITGNDLALIERYGQTLRQIASDFPDIFFNYLFGYPPTAGILNDWLNQGASITSLLKQQDRYISQWLALDISNHNAEKLLQVGRKHHGRRIDPQWVILSYQFQVKHLINIITDHPAVAANDRRPLQDALSKLLFRDLSLVFEGYCRAAGGIPRQLEQGMDTLQAHMTNLIANLPYVFWSVELPGHKLLYLSPGNDPRDVCEANLPIPLFNDIINDDQIKIINAWEQAVQGGKQQVEGRVLDDAGNIRWQRYLLTPCRNIYGTVIRMDGCIEDITDVRETMDRLQHLATTDMLTGLANRTLWYDRMNMAIHAAQRRPGHRVAIMMLDMNHFKLINDTMGHPVGDAVLHQAAQRMKIMLRDADTLARIGGDEFGVLLSDTDDTWTAAKQVAKKVLGCFNEPFSCKGHEMYLGASIGVAIYPDHGQDADSLVSRADIAMYRAKQRGSGYMFYNPGTDINAIKQLQLSNQLRQALQRNELELHYQPKIDLHNARLCGVEALLRWRHPQHGLIEPDQFIPLAEQIGIMAPITEWVIGNALDTSARWQQQGVHLPLAVNVSALCLQNPALVQWVKSVITSSGAPPPGLELEITENTVMGDVDQNFDVLMSLNELGVRIAIDDFGTGYSSLAYLKRLPINTLKIDKSFVMDMALDDNDAVIVRSIIELGHNLGFNVVAEGVENADVWDLLNILGCDEAQGFHISPPLTETSLLPWIAQSPWRLNA